jgi:hypothetical protein
MVDGMRQYIAGIIYYYTSVQRSCLHLLQHFKTDSQLAPIPTPDNDSKDHTGQPRRYFSRCARHTTFAGKTDSHKTYLQLLLIRHQIVGIDLARKTKSRSGSIMVERGT